jgi:hypothetical protein
MSRLKHCSMTNTLAYFVTSCNGFVMLTITSPVFLQDIYFIINISRWMVACHCVCSHHMLALCVCMRGRHYEKESVPVFERVCACCVWLMMVHGESCIVCVLEGLPIVCVRQSVCFSMCLCVAFVFVRICDGLWGILYCACASWCVCVFVCALCMCKTECVLWCVCVCCICVCTYL